MKIAFPEKQKEKRIFLYLRILNHQNYLIKKMKRLIKFQEKKHLIINIDCYRLQRIREFLLLPVYCSTM